MIYNINLKDIEALSKEVGVAIMKIYQRNFQIDYKDDKSPRTEADLKSNEIICEALEKLYPEFPMLLEENKEILFVHRDVYEELQRAEMSIDTNKLSADEATLEIVRYIKNKC